MCTVQKSIIIYQYNERSLGYVHSSRFALQRPYSWVQMHTLPLVYYTEVFVTLKVIYLFAITVQTRVQTHAYIRLPVIYVNSKISQILGTSYREGKRRYFFSFCFAPKMQLFHDAKNLWLFQTVSTNHRIQIILLLQYTTGWKSIFKVQL